MKMFNSYLLTWFSFSVVLVGLASSETNVGLYDAASKEPGYQLNIGHLPILVTITDLHGHPISGAHAALKRVQPGGYTKEYITDPTSPQIDSKGQLLIDYPTVPNPDSSIPGEILLRGAITVIAEGYRIAVIELSKEFPKPQSFIAASSIPWLKITMIRAQQEAPVQPPPAPPQK